MLQRPKIGETDEDILKLQRAFEESKAKTSVSVIKNNGKLQLSLNNILKLYCYLIYTNRKFWK